MRILRTQQQRQQYQLEFNLKTVLPFHVVKGFHMCKLSIEVRNLWRADYLRLFYQWITLIGNRKRMILLDEFESINFGRRYSSMKSPSHIYINIWSEIISNSEHVEFGFHLQKLWIRNAIGGWCGQIFLWSELNIHIFSELLIRHHVASRKRWNSKRRLRQWWMRYMN